MMSSLPKELTKEQQGAVRELFDEHSSIFSKGEYDIGRTPYVEYRINSTRELIALSDKLSEDTHSSIWTLLTSKSRE